MLPLELLSRGDDGGGVLSLFFVAKAWEELRPRGFEVKWTHVVWFSHCIPRCAFHLWLTLRGSLQTQDKLHQWDVWCYVRSLADLENVPPLMHLILIWFISIARQRSARSIIGRTKRTIVVLQPKRTLIVQKPKSKRTRFGGDGVAVEFGGGGCGGEVAGRVVVAAAKDDDDGGGEAARREFGRASGVDGECVDDRDVGSVRWRLSDAARGETVDVDSGGWMAGVRPESGRKKVGGAGKV
ncbi:putative reverse transcriptase domain-containing protein [Tanacetum coccineum]